MPDVENVKPGAGETEYQSDAASSSQGLVPVIVLFCRSHSMQLRRLPAYLISAASALLLAVSSAAPVESTRPDSDDGLNRQELATGEDEPGVHLPERADKHKFRTISRTRRKPSRDRLVELCKEAVSTTARRMLSTEHHTPWQMMHALLGLREEFHLMHQGEPISGLGWISQGQIFNDEHWFEKTRFGGRAHPYSVPYAFEGHANQFLAVLSMCGLDLDHEFGTAKGTITMRDMIRNAQMTVSYKDEPTWTLWALSRYLPPDAVWRNQMGESWSIEKLVRIQTSKSMQGAPCGGTHGLFALAHARNVYLRQGKPLRGVWMQAEYKIRKYINTARMQQNSNGSLSSNYFRSRQYNPDFNKRMASAGHILEFLMIALPQKELSQLWVRRAIESTARDLLNSRNAEVKCSPLYHSVNALNIYLDRVNPRVQIEDVVQRKPEAKTAQADVPASEEGSEKSPTKTGADHKPATVKATPVSQGHPVDEEAAETTAKSVPDSKSADSPTEQTQKTEGGSQAPTEQTMPDDERTETVTKPAADGWKPTPKEKRTPIVHEEHSTADAPSAAASPSGKPAISGDATEPADEKPTLETVAELPAPEESEVSRTEQSESRDETRLLKPIEKGELQEQDAVDSPPAASETKASESSSQNAETVESDTNAARGDANATAAAKPVLAESADDKHSSDDHNETETAPALGDTQTATDTGAQADGETTSDAPPPSDSGDKTTAEAGRLKVDSVSVTRPAPKTASVPANERAASAQRIADAATRAPVLPTENARAEDRTAETGASASYAAAPPRNSDVTEVRSGIAGAAGLKSGMIVASIGADTGLLLRSFSNIVGPNGRVYALETRPVFVKHLNNIVSVQKLSNVTVVRHDPRSLMLGRIRLDRAFVGDSFHSLDYPEFLLASILKSLKPGGELVIADSGRTIRNSAATRRASHPVDRQAIRRRVVGAGFEFVDEVTVSESSEYHILRFKRPSGR